MTNIKKTLIYYWYVHSTGWNDLYDLHISNLKLYKDVFDKEIFIISRDDDTKPEYVSAVIDKLRDVFPDAEFKEYKNDKILRESCFFYNEIATKLQDYSDEWYFFAHNKGVDTRYTSKDICKDWICGMYFMNLAFMDSIETNMNLKDTCVIGTYLIRNIKHWSFLKYKWHFSGTYWWFNPRRVYNVMKENNNDIPSNDRYFTEGFFGSVIPDDEMYRRPALMVYDADWKKGTTWMPEKLKKCYYDMYNKVEAYVGRSNAQMFVLCHKDVDYNIPNNSLYTPILCGSDINAVNSDYLNDNVGDNISSLNPFYLECTGTYWIWKNKVSQYKYVGQCQYRRQLLFKDDFDFDSAFRQHDFIAATPYYFTISVYDHYGRYHNIDDLKIIGDVIRDIFPEYYAAWNYTMSHNMLFYSAGFVFKSEMYDKYCQFLFDVLLEYRERLNLATIEDVKKYVTDNIKNGKYNNKFGNLDVNYQCRLGGYLAERLFTCFVHKNMKSPMLVNYTKMEKC